MKRILTALLIMATLALQSQVPDYLENNPQWRVSWSFGYYYPCIINQDYVYYINGDSLLDGHVYKKVFWRGEVDYVWYDNPPAYNCDNDHTFDEFYTLIRQDSLKMYTHYGQQEELLYDFNLEVGDTLPQTNHIMDIITVDSIYNIQVMDSYRKVYKLEGDYVFDNILIEGIGFDGGPFELFPNPEFPSMLHCFIQNDTSWWSQPWMPCDLNVNIPSLLMEAHFECYPNPVESFLTIKSNVAVNIEKIIVYNQLGQVVKLNSRLISNHHFELDFSVLKRGIYMLQITTQDNSPSLIKVIKR